MIRFFLSQLLMIPLNGMVLGQDSKLYELRAYSIEPGRQADALKLMSLHGVRFLKKHNIDLIGVWTPLETSDERIYMLVRHESKEVAMAAWSAFQNDADWKIAVKNSEVDGKKPVKGIEQFFLTTNDYSPKLEIKSVGNRIFELRTYVATPNNLAALNNRFRNHTMALFEKHGMTNVVYWSVRDGEQTTCEQLLNAFSPVSKGEAKVEPGTKATGNSLIYFLTHASPESAKESFEKFRNDASWQKVLKESEVSAGGPLTVQGGVKSLYLKPTDFSPLK